MTIEGYDGGCGQDALFEALTNCANNRRGWPSAATLARESKSPDTLTKAADS